MLIVHGKQTCFEWQSVFYDIFLRTFRGVVPQVPLNFQICKQYALLLLGMHTNISRTRWHDQYFDGVYFSFLLTFSMSWPAFMQVDTFCFGNSPAHAINVRDQWFTIWFTPTLLFGFVPWDSAGIEVPSAVAPLLLDEPIH